MTSKTTYIDTTTTAPELRFPEFHDDWQVKRLGECFDERIEKKCINLPLLSLTENGIIPQEETNRKDNSNSDKSKYLRVCIGDIAYNTMRMWQGRCVWVDTEGIVSPAYTVCKPKENIFSLFFYYMFKTQKMINVFHQHSQGLVNDTLNLKYEKFSAIRVSLPTLAEQRKIAMCLSSLDDLIKAIGDKIELLKQHKKGLMQKMFPKKDGTICGRGHGRDAKFCVSTNPTIVPELRFPEFSGDWQVKPLGECFVMLQNNTLSRAELNDKCGDYQNVHYGDVLIKYGSILNASKEQLPYINNNNVAEKYDKSLLNDGDVIIADTAEDETVGKCTEIINVGDKKIISGLHTIPIRSIIDFAKCFIGLYFNSNIWHSQLLRIMQGTKVYSISKSQLKNLSVCFPTLSEQRKIAACLSSIDAAIEETENKLQKLQQHKKGLMQRMFVRRV